MSALWKAESPQIQAMTVAHLDAVMAVENAAYAFPWTRGNFIDSLASGYPARVLLGQGGELLGYFVAMGGVDEMHLLNITVAPAAQGRGHARAMFELLVSLCQERHALELWLEVRASNARARALYAHLGFRQVGKRRGYYPAPLGRREDAIVMSRNVASDPSAQPGANDALG